MLIFMKKHSFLKYYSYCRPIIVLKPPNNNLDYNTYLLNYLLTYSMQQNPS